MDSSRRSRLARSLPFYYGWVVFAVSASTSYYSRPLMAVATLSVFVVPMTDEFGWSRGLFSGVVSLGGLCAVIISPVVGRLIDRYGSGMMLAATSVIVGSCAIGLSMVSNSWAFYSLYVPGRMAFASPLELGTTTAVSNWFIRRRSLVHALLSVSQGTGLAAMPLVAQFIIGGWNWRVAWLSLGIYTLTVGVLPPLLLMARRPEDIGLTADPLPSERKLVGEPAPDQERPASAGSGPMETNFTVGQALRTRAFWVLSAFSAAGFMVQAGVSLHQVSHFISQGLPASQAAFTAGTFALCQVPGGLLWAALARRVPVRFLLSLAGLSVAIGAAATAASTSLSLGLPAVAILGAGVGGLHLLLRLVWADYYGRRHLGSIRGLTLPVQIAGQALGPITAGFAFDWTHSYVWPFQFFAISVFLGSLLVLFATPPRLRSELAPETRADAGSGS